MNKIIIGLYFGLLINVISCNPIEIVSKNNNNNGGNQNNEEFTDGLFEGDMILNEFQKSILLGDPKENQQQQRIGLINENTRWPDNTVIYRFSDVFSNVQIDYIELGLQKIADATCIRFKHHTNEPGYIEFMGRAGGGCSSNVGYGGGRQTINLELYEPEVGCFRQATIVHEMLHALGIYHMQSSTVRDDYVDIITDNIQSGTINNFNKYDETVISLFGVPYDVGSVMHYGAYAFSKNGYATIVPKDISRIDELGQRVGMSQSDIDRLNAMYCV